jgi:acyl carrier protein
MMGELTRAKTLLAEATGVGVAAVPESAQIGRFEPWDSLAHMRLILAIEEQIGRMLDPDETIQIDCLDDVARLLNSCDAAA